MRENNEKLSRESDAAFEIATVLLNLLILLVIYGSLWMMQSILSQPNSLGVFLRDSAIYQ
jgi:hypothetical protein